MQTDPMMITDELRRQADHVFDIADLQGAIGKPHRDLKVASQFVHK
ncbi:MAG: hypothetical protein JSR78_09245 [Proteobacteria bacterium]|nr:hypothetical protein [Pseudomonadota bacterium]